MIALIDYGAGNSASVANALKDLAIDFVITDNKEKIEAADKIIFPGVGEASFAINRLKSADLFDLLKSTNKPLLGICLGMQLLCSMSEEGNTECIGIFPVNTVMFNDANVKVPHMGWNKVNMDNTNKLFDGLNADDYFYFANSYYIPACDYTIARCTHGIEFSAAIAKDNFYGLQFHPEKSGPSGIQLLKNFVDKC